jgi:hypothetical protein
LGYPVTIVHPEVLTLKLANWLLLSYGSHGTGATPDGGKPGRPAAAADLPLDGEQRRGVAVDAIEATLGQVLLLLIGLAVVLFILILLLVEAHYIVRLSRKLVGRLRSVDLDVAGTGSSPARDDASELPFDQQEVR